LNKDEQIRLLEEELSTLTKNAGKQIPFQAISAEARANYENIDALGFSYQVRTDFKKTDTVPVFEIDWKDGVSSSKKAEDSKKMLAWLKLRLQDSTLVIKEID
jgi:hypothetical protein